MQIVIALLIGAVLAAAGCDGDDPDAPYVAFGGGGFVFNFRLAQVTYGFVATPKRKMPGGTVLEAKFDDPAGGPAIVVRRMVAEGQVQYSFETPPVNGVKADTPYKAVLRVIDPKTGAVLGEYERVFRAQIDQSVLGRNPRTVGPGYHGNPEHRPAPE